MKYLKGMSIKNQLLKTIYRSEQAYSNYKDQKLFYQAHRIYKANLVLYKLLEDYLLECPEEQKADVCRFIFHLDDWIAQFEFHKKGVKKTDVFAFPRWEASFPYPKDFVNSLIN